MKKSKYMIASIMVVGMCETSLSWFERDAIPLFLSASDSKRESFARVVNRSEHKTDIRITAIDDAGTNYGPLTYNINGNSVLHVNSRDLEERLIEEFGEHQPEGDWRLVIHSLSKHIESQSYIRTTDGFVTSMHDVCDNYWSGQGLFVFFFNPASNAAQRSRLRLTNPHDSDMEAIITGLDDEGKSPGTKVRLVVPAGASKSITAEELEAGAEGLEGALGNGNGKWRLWVQSEKRLYVMSLLENPTGHLTNLSTSASGRDTYFPMMLAKEVGQQGFVRIINYDDVEKTASLTVVDEHGRKFPPLELEIASNSAFHLNSDDLKKMLNSDGAEVGNWYLYIDGGFRARTYVRTEDGFVTDVSYVSPKYVWNRENAQYQGEGPSYIYIPFVNPGSNSNQRSLVRFANADHEDVKIAIVGVDDEGNSPGEPVRMTIPARSSRTFSALELEQGSDLFDGRIGDGAGKWRLFIIADELRERRLGVGSLLESPTGHITNLVTRGNAVSRSNVVLQPPVIRGPNLKRAILHVLGKEPSHVLTWLDLAGLESLDLSGLDCYTDHDRAHPNRECNNGSWGRWPKSDINGRGRISDLYGVHFAYNLESLNLRHNVIEDIAPIAYIASSSFRELDLGFNLIGDLSPLAGVSTLERLDLRGNFRGVRTVLSPGSPARRERFDGLEDLSSLSELVNLTSLDLGLNDIADLGPLSGLVNLTSLELKSNHIWDLGPLSGLVNLTSLELAVNHISDLGPLSGLVNLNSLVLQSNAISDLEPLFGLVGLTRLELSRNRISNLEPLSDLVNLTSLMLTSNNISDLGPLSGLVNLEHLDFGSNDISDLRPLSGMVNLTALIVDSSDFSDPEPLRNLVGLTSLVLRGTAVSDIAPLGNLAELRVLDLSETVVSDITPISDLSKLYRLDLSRTAVSDISPLASHARMQHLAVAGNGVTDLTPVGNMLHLITLDVHDNQITDIGPLSELEWIRELNLAENRIRSLSALEKVARLSDLDIRSNYVSDLSPLVSLTKLASLDLGANDIRDLAPLAANSGFGYGDQIRLRLNPMFDAVAYDTHIPDLTGRGVMVDYHAPDGDEFPVSRLSRVFGDNLLVMDQYDESEFSEFDGLLDLVGVGRSGLLDDYTREVYTAFEDSFDFLVFVLDGSYEWYEPNPVLGETAYTTLGPTGSHVFVKNETRGIGLKEFYENDYGSASRLRGVIVLAGYKWLNSHAMLHLLMRSWANHFDLEVGAGAEGYWGISNANGILGGFDQDSFVDLGGGLYQTGSFSTHYGMEMYGSLELYLSGHLQRTEVPDLWVFPDGRKVDYGIIESRGGIKKYTISDVVARYGERVPAYVDAQRNWRAAIVVFPPWDNEDEYLQELSDAAVSFSYGGGDDNDDVYNFFEATGGRGTITFDGLGEWRKQTDSAPRGLPHSVGDPPWIVLEEFCTKRWCQLALGEPWH